MLVKPTTYLVEKGIKMASKINVLHLEVDDVNGSRIETVLSVNGKAAGLRIWPSSPYCPGNRDSILDEFVSDEIRGKGHERQLLKKAVEVVKGKPLAGQFSNIDFIKAAFALGFRSEEWNTLEETLRIKEKSSSVFMIYRTAEERKEQLEKTKRGEGV